MATRWAVFIDKDGTLLEDVPFNADPQHMRFAPGAAEGLRLLAALKVPLIVISNQPGIALGRIPIAAMQGMTEHLQKMFASCGAMLADFYYCPHHPDGSVSEYAMTCDCRKPASGLIRRAVAEHRIEPGRSWMIGDILDDIEAGCRCKCQTILIDNGNETLWQASVLRTPDYIVSNLWHAAAIINASATRALKRGPLAGSYN